MNKKEIAEIKRQLTPDRCAVTRICGCYIDGEKNRKAQFKEAFLSLPEEEAFKYFDIFRKTLSGSIGKNLLNMEFPLDSEFTGGAQEFLRLLRDSRLEDDALLGQFYDKVVESYDCGENYLILLIHGVYDIPGKTSDGLELFDGSEEVYEYLLGCVCPVKLSKPGLSYDDEAAAFHERVRDWIVEMPSLGFLFPAFNDRQADLHSILYYTSKPQDLKERLVDGLLGCQPPLSCPDQKEAFGQLVEDTLGDGCSYEVARNIQENLAELIAERSDEPQPPTLEKEDIRDLLQRSGAQEEELAELDQKYTQAAGDDAVFCAANLADLRKFEVKTPNITVQVKPEYAALVETRQIDGRPCLVVPLDGQVTVNGLKIVLTEFPQ